MTDKYAQYSLSRINVVRFHDDKEKPMPNIAFRVAKLEQVADGRQYKRVSAVPYGGKCIHDRDGIH
jgi:hypothetical protein